MDCLEKPRSSDNFETDLVTIRNRWLNFLIQEFLGKQRFQENVPGIGDPFIRPHAPGLITPRLPPKTPSPNLCFGINEQPLERRAEVGGGVPTHWYPVKKFLLTNYFIKNMSPQ